MAHLPNLGKIILLKNPEPSPLPTFKCLPSGKISEKFDVKIYWEVKKVGFGPKNVPFTPFWA